MRQLKEGVKLSKRTRAGVPLDEGVVEGGGQEGTAGTGLGGGRRGGGSRPAGWVTGPVCTPESQT